MNKKAHRDIAIHVTGTFTMAAYSSRVFNKEEQNGCTDEELAMGVEGTYQQMWI